MSVVHRALAVCAAAGLLAGAAPSLAAAESSHESRQDHLIHVLQADVASVTTSVNTVSKSVTSLTGQLTSLSTAVYRLAAVSVPEYGIARLATTGVTSGSTSTNPYYLPGLYSPNVPRDGIDPAIVSGEVAVPCTTAPCTVQLVSAIRSARGTPAAGKAPGQIGGGIIVTNASTGALVAAVNVASDGKHTGGQVNLTNVNTQVGLGSADAATFTQVPFDSTGAVLNGGATLSSSGVLSIPNTGSYVINGTLYFYDFDNVSGTASARDGAQRRVAHGS